MLHQVLDFLREQLAIHGYWTVALALLLENAGVPVPGETILLLASALAFSEHRLHLPYLILVGTLAATLGDNLGFAIGRRGGRPLLDRYKHWFRIPDHTIARGELLFARYGAATIFFARFVFGMRVIAGPLAGVLRMPWGSFAVFNFLGAALWVSVISTVGYLFGRHWQDLVRLLHRVDVGALVLVIVVAAWLWLRRPGRRGQ
jgi:membrane-associated protein